MWCIRMQRKQIFTSLLFFFFFFFSLNGCLLSFSERGIRKLISFIVCVSGIFFVLPSWSSLLSLAAGASSRMPSPNKSVSSLRLNEMMVGLRTSVTFSTCGSSSDRSERSSSLTGNASWEGWGQNADVVTTLEEESRRCTGLHLRYPGRIWRFRLKVRVVHDEGEHLLGHGSVGVRVRVVGFACASLLPALGLRRRLCWTQRDGSTRWASARRSSGGRLCFRSEMKEYLLTDFYWAVWQKPKQKSSAVLLTVAH